jgi:TolB protein
LLALGLLATVALLLLTVFGRGLFSLNSERGKTVALNLCQQKLEQELALPQSQLAAGAGTFDGQFAAYKWTVQIDTSGAVPKVVVTVAGLPGQNATLSAYHRGANGRIVYSQTAGDGSSENLFTALPDGSGVQQLTKDQSRNTDAAISSNGHTIVFASNRSGMMELYSLDLNGGDPHQLTTNADGARSPAISPDGQTVAFVATDNGYAQIFTMSIGGGTAYNISQTQSHEGAPSWSPDGSQLVWTTDRWGGMDLVIGSRGGGLQQRLTDAPGWNASPAWSPDGTQISFISTRDGQPGLYVVDPNTKVVKALSTSGASSSPSWSPDGHQLAFESEQDGKSAVYVMNRDGTGQRPLLSSKARSSTSARAPSWVR